MSISMRQSVQCTVALAVTTLLVACGQAAKDAGVQHVQHANPVASSKPGNGIDPDMVSAVSLTGAPGTPVSMKFRLSARPQVTSPLQVTVLVIPSPDVQISGLHLSFQADDGLQLQSDRSFDLTQTTPGLPVQQEITVVPQQTGVLSLSATVLIDTDSQSISRTYSIPLIASDGHG